MGIPLEKLNGYTEYSILNVLKLQAGIWCAIWFPVEENQFPRTSLAELVIKIL